MRIDGHRQVVSNATAQPGPLLRPADMQARALQDLFDAQGVGVPVEHALRMQAVARQTNTVFGIRPVERIVTTLIEEGFPTKGFSVKGKSSNWGPQAGFICVDQHLSKRENRDTAEIRKLNLAVAKGMDGGAYTQTDLRISQQRLAELVRNFGLVADGVGPVRLLTAQGPSGKRYEFEARQEPDGLYRISRLGRSEAVQVLASPACGLAMTADYDLFLVAPSIEAHGNGGLDARRNTAVRYTPLGAKDPLSEDGFYGREDMARGNITPRTRQLVDALNDCLGRGEHREMFHHSDDAGNPAPIWVTTSRPPSTFPGPWSIGSEKSPFASMRSAWWRIGRAFPCWSSASRATAITSPPIPTGTCRCGPASRRRSTFPT